MTIRTSLAALVFTIALAPAPAVAKPHACGKPTCTTEGNCEVCKTPMCEKRPGPDGKPTDAIVGSKTERTCTETEAQAPSGAGRALEEAPTSGGATPRVSTPALGGRAVEATR